MNVLIAPDKFKGSLTSFEACRAIAEGIGEAARAARADRQATTAAPEGPGHEGMQVQMLPMADGGDGFAAVMKHYLGTETRTCRTVDPLGRPMDATYELRGEVAIVEMATASGLVLLSEEERDVMKTSTLGTGMMVRDAANAGARKILLGLGGSATNDAGTGILAALGFRFLDDKGQELAPVGGNLGKIARIAIPDELPALSFEIACDVNNVLYGPNGAAFVYSPQKGASPREVVLLDQGLRHFAGLLTLPAIADIPGSGAAGGIASGLMGFFPVDLKKGIELVMDSSGIHHRMADVDLVITGEGKIDRQSTFGKVVSEIAALAAAHHIPAIAFCGVSEAGQGDLRALSLDSITPITPAGMDLRTAMLEAPRLLRDAAHTVIGRDWLRLK